MLEEGYVKMALASYDALRDNLFSMTKQRDEALKMQDEIQYLYSLLREVAFLQFEREFWIIDWDAPTQQYVASDYHIKTRYPHVSKNALLRQLFDEYLEFRSAQERKELEEEHAREVAKEVDEEVTETEE